MASSEPKGSRLPRPPRRRPVRHPQPLGRRLGPGPRGARLQGARHDQLGLRVHARPPRRQRHARRGRRPHARARPRRPACRSPSTSRTGTARTPSTPRRRSRARRRRARSAARSRTGTRAASCTGSDHAVERVAAAAEAARGLDFPFTLTARAENHIRGNPDLDDTIARLQAYERAGADVLFAPGLRSGDEIRGSATPCRSRSTCSPSPACRWARSSRPAGSGSASAAALAFVALARRGRRRRADPRHRRLLGAGRAGQPQGAGSAADGALRRLPARGQPRRQAQDRQRRAALLLRGDRPGGRADVPHQRQRGVRRRRASRRPS